MAKLISGTYGEALFELAKETNKLELLGEQIAVVREIFAENEELLKLLNHPKVTKEEKIQVIENIFKGRFEDEVVGFLVIIVEKGRYNEIDSILTYFINKVKEDQKIGVAKVVSAIELSAEQKAKLEAKLLSQTDYVKFEMCYEVDASLIGGMIIRIGDRVVDSSVKSKLDRMARDMAKIQLGNA